MQPDPQPALHQLSGLGKISHLISQSQGPRLSHGDKNLSHSAMRIKQSDRCKVFICLAHNC